MAIALIISACSASKKANNYFDKNLGELAVKCQEKFPNDTIDRVIHDTVLKAHNDDFTKPIDSVKQEADNLQKLLQQSDTIKACKEVVAAYKKTVSNLQSNINKLQDNYKPCKPDTLIITKSYYIERTGKIEALKFQLSEMSAKEEKQRKRGDFWQKWALWASGLVALGGVGFILKLRKII